MRCKLSYKFLRSNRESFLYPLFPSDGIFGVETWGPNVEEFKSRFDPETTDGEGPLRLKNLYFTYLVVLRAIAKAAPLLEEESFYTGLFWPVFIDR